MLLQIVCLEELQGKKEKSSILVLELELYMDIDSTRMCTLAQFHVTLANTALTFISLSTTLTHRSTYFIIFPTSE